MSKGRKVESHLVLGMRPCWPGLKTIEAITLPYARLIGILDPCSKLL